MQKDYPKIVLDAFPKLEILDGVRLKVTKRLMVLDEPSEAKVEIPPSVPWLQGFEWEKENQKEEDEQSAKEVKRVDRLSKECKKLDAQARGLVGKP